MTLMSQSEQLEKTPETRFPKGEGKKPSIPIRKLEFGVVNWMRSAPCQERDGLKIKNNEWEK